MIASRPHPLWSAAFAALTSAFLAALLSSVTGILGCIVLWKGFAVPTAPSDWAGVIFTSLSNVGIDWTLGLTVGMWAAFWETLRHRGAGFVRKLLGVLLFVVGASFLQEVVDAATGAVRPPQVLLYRRLFTASLGAVEMLELLPLRTSRRRLALLQAFGAGTVMVLAHQGAGNSSVIVIANGLVFFMHAFVVLAGARLGLSWAERRWGARSCRSIPWSATIKLAAAGFLSGFLGVLLLWGLTVPVVILSPQPVAVGAASAAMILAFPMFFVMSLVSIQSAGPPEGRLRGRGLVGIGSAAGAVLLMPVVALGVLQSAGYPLSADRLILMFCLPVLVGWCLWWALETGWRTGEAPQDKDNS